VLRAVLSKPSEPVSPADDMAEKLQNEVTLHDVDAAALQQLVEYSYTGEILITEDNVQV
jgi:BTB/POZ domain.